MVQTRIEAHDASELRRYMRVALIVSPRHYWCANASKLDQMSRALPSASLAAIYSLTSLTLGSEDRGQMDPVYLTVSMGVIGEAAFSTV